MKILIIGPLGGGYIFLPNSLNYLQIKRPKHGIEKPEIFSTLFCLITCFSDIADIKYFFRQKH